MSSPCKMPKGGSGGNIGLGLQAEKESAGNATWGKTPHQL